MSHLHNGCKADFVIKWDYQTLFPSRTWYCKSFCSFPEAGWWAGCRSLRADPLRLLCVCSPLLLDGCVSEADINQLRFRYTSKIGRCVFYHLQKDRTVSSPVDEYRHPDGRFSCYPILNVILLIQASAVSEIIADLTPIKVTRVETDLIYMWLLWNTRVLEEDNSHWHQRIATIKMTRNTRRLSGKRNDCCKGWTVWATIWLHFKKCYFP